MDSSKQGGLVWHSLVLMAATQVGSVANLLFQMVMGRALSVEQYGVLASMLVTIIIIATPMDAIRTAFAHFSARLDAEGRASEIRLLVNRWFRDVLWFSVPVLLLACLFGRPLSVFFNLESRVPILLTGVMVAASPFLPILAGAFQGVQAFVWMAATSQGWSLVRLILGGALVLLIAPVAALGLVGQAVGLIVSIALGWVGLRVVLGAAPATVDLPKGVTTYFLRSLLVLGGFAVLMNADIIMVKHFFAPEDAGLFARASTIGRSIIFLPMPIALAMFPKVTSDGAVSSHNWVMLFKALLFAAAIILSAVLLTSLLPKLALLVLFGDHAPTDAIVRLVRAVVWAMSPLGLAYVILNFEMAQHRFKPALTLVPCAIAYVVGVSLWHQTVFQVAAVLATVSCTAVILLALGLPWKKTSPAA